jgi:hypothetical protein
MEMGFYTVWPHPCDRDQILATLEVYTSQPSVIGPTLYRPYSFAGLVIRRSLPEGELSFFGLMDVDEENWSAWVWIDPVVQAERYRAPQLEGDPLIHLELQLRLWYDSVLLGRKLKGVRGRPPGPPPDLEERRQRFIASYEAAEKYLGKPPNKTEVEAWSEIPRQTFSGYIDKGWFPDLFNQHTR